MANRAPPKPAMAAETAKAVTRARTGEMPIDSAAISLPRRARNTRPVVPSRSWITKTETTVKAATARTRNRRSSAKSHGPIVGRGTRVPWKSEVPPPPIQENLTITASKKKAKASVAMASQTPPSRRTGSDRTAPTAAARAAPTRAAESTDRSYRSASWNTVKAPTAAKAP